MTIGGVEWEILFQPDPVAAVRLEVLDLRNGEYRVRYLSTRAAEFHLRIRERKTGQEIKGSGGRIRFLDTERRDAVSPEQSFLFGMTAGMTIVHRKTMEFGIQAVQRDGRNSSTSWYPWEVRIQGIDPDNSGEEIPSFLFGGRNGRYEVLFLAEKLGRFRLRIQSPEGIQSVSPSLHHFMVSWFQDFLSLTSLPFSLSLLH